jgi:hypothetical protein
MRYRGGEKFCDSLVYERMLFAARDDAVPNHLRCGRAVLVRVVFGAE